MEPALGHRHGRLEWTALLGVVYVSVGLVGASLRGLSEGRDVRGWRYAAIALAAFAGWSAVARYSVALAVIGAAMVLIAVAVDAVTRPHPRPAMLGEPATKRPPTRTVMTALITAVVGFFLIALLVALIEPTGG